MDDIIEGIDYIFDRYSFLDLSPSATTDDIRKSIRLKRAENHPDKLQRVSSDILALAKKTMSLLDDCEKVLLNENVRALYDQKLQHFLDNENYLVSRDGVAKIDPSRFKINLNYLLSEEIYDFSDLKSQALKMTNYNEKKLAKAKSRYEATPGFDEKQELREQLTYKIVYFNIMEDYYWQSAGINGGYQPNENYRAQSVDDLTEQFEAKLSLVKDSTHHAVENRNGAVLLGFTKPLLLGTNVENDNSTTMLVEKAVKSFELRSEDLKLLVKERNETIKELAQVSLSKELSSNKGPITDIFLLKPVDDVDSAWPEMPSETLGMCFRLDTQSGNITSFNFTEPLTQDVIDTWDNNIYVLEPNREIGAPLIETMALAERIIEQM